MTDEPDRKKPDIDPPARRHHRQASPRSGALRSDSQRTLCRRRRARNSEEGGHHPAPGAAPPGPLDLINLLNAPLSPIPGRGIWNSHARSAGACDWMQNLVLQWVYTASLAATGRLGSRRRQDLQAIRGMRRAELMSLIRRNPFASLFLHLVRPGFLQDLVLRGKSD